MSGPNWGRSCPALIRIFSALAFADETTLQDPPWNAQWRDRSLKSVPMKGPMKGTSLLMRITSIVGVGDDDRRLVFVPANTAPATRYNNAYQETFFGMRRVTLNLECQMSDIADGSDSISLLERIRSRLRRRSVIDDLQANDIALVQILASRALPVKAEAHIQSRSQMEVILTMLSGDTNPIAVGWIATLSISSRIQNTDGTVLPVPPNFNDLIVNLP